MSSLKIFSWLILFLCVFSCKKDDKIIVKEEPPFASAGTNREDVEEFQVVLNADTLKSGQSGKWSIEKGLVEDLVYFSDSEKPDAIFNGMPGETYELKWTVAAGKKLYSESIVKVAFKPLKAIISNDSPTNQTNFNLSGNKYEDGLWEIDGKYATLVGDIRDGTSLPAEKCEAINLQGYARTSYKIKWTTYYGSKSASTTLDLTTGNYTEREALDYFFFDKDIEAYRVGYENGHVVKLNLVNSKMGLIMGDTVNYPALQGLTYLKSLDVSSSSLTEFPPVIADKYHQLEYLNLDYNSIGSLPENIGNLKKLKYFSLTGSSGRGGFSMPSSFGDLESLEYLELSSLVFSAIPESFGKLKNLRYFSFEGKPIVTLPDNIGDLKNLEVLYGSTMKSLPASVTKLTKLRRLDFTVGDSWATMPADIGNLKMLDTLELRGNYFEVPPSFAKLTDLSILTLSSPVLKSLPENIGNLKKLKYLTFGGDIKSLPDSFCNLSSLESLVASGEFEYLPKEFGKLHNLVEMTIESGKLKALPETFGQLKSLKRLKLKGNAITSLPSSFFDLPVLNALDLSYNHISTISVDFAKLNGILGLLYIHGNKFSKEDGLLLKKLLPNIHIDLLD